MKYEKRKIEINAELGVKMRLRCAVEGGGGELCTPEYSIFGTLRFVHHRTSSARSHSRLLTAILH